MISTGLVVIGAALGISVIGFAGMQAMARQPEIQGKLQTSMIIAAALIEGVALFGLVVCLIK